MRRRDRRSSTVRYTHSTSYRRGAGARMTGTLDHPDSYRPASFEPALTEDEKRDIRARLGALIADAAARGALDAGNWDYADPWIAGHLSDWLHRLPDQLVQRQTAGARLVAITAAFQAEAEEVLADRRAERARLAALLGRYERELTGEAASAGEPATDTEAPTDAGAPEARPLRPATQLDGHDLRDTPSGAGYEPRGPIAPNVHPLRPASDRGPDDQLHVN